MSRIYKSLPGGKLKRMTDRFGGSFKGGHLDDDYYDELEAFRNNYGLDELEAYIRGTSDDDLVVAPEPPDFGEDSGVELVHGVDGIVYASYGYRS